MEVGTWMADDRPRVKFYVGANRLARHNCTSTNEHVTEFMQSLWHKKWIGCVLIHHFTLTFFTLGGLNVTFCVVFINKRLRVWKYTNTFEFNKCLNIVCRSCLFLYVTSHNVVIFYFSFILIHDPTKSLPLLLLLRFVFESTSFSLALLDSCAHDHQHAWIKILIISLTQNPKQKRKLVFGAWVLYRIN